MQWFFDLIGNKNISPSNCDDFNIFKKSWQRFMHACRLDWVWNQFNNEMIYIIIDVIGYNYNLYFNIKLSSIIFHARIVLFKPESNKNLSLKIKYFRMLRIKALSLQLCYSVNDQQLSLMS